MADTIVSAGALEQINVGAPIALVYAPLFTKHLASYGISDKREVAALVANSAYETQLFTRLEEQMGYSAIRLIAVWPSRFRMPQSPDETRLDAFEDGKRNASFYAMQPERLAEFVYGGRMGNRAEGSGDGFAFRGRGCPMLTGRANYRGFQDESTIPVLDDPDLLLEPDHAVDAACWFYENQGCSVFALGANWPAVCRAWQGGNEGLAMRTAMTTKLLGAL